MPQSLSRILNHMIFSTKNREPLLTPEIQPRLFAYLATTLANSGNTPIIVGGWNDHVHLLFGMSRTMTIAQIAEHVKTGSSKWIKTQGDHFSVFHWQNGYGAFSAAASTLDSVVRYIRNQDQHHRTQSFQDEFRRFLVEYGIEYDERYVWD